MRVQAALEVRAELRRLRKLSFRNGRDFAKQSGLSHSTVAKIENLAKNHSYDPGAIVIAKYLDPLGLTLSGFFLRLERLEHNDASDEGLRRSGLSLPSREPLVQNASHVPGTTSPNGRHLDVVANPQVDEAVGRALIRASETIRNQAIASAVGRAGGALLVEAGTHARQLRSALPSTRRKKPKLGKPRP